MISKLGFSVVAPRSVTTPDSAWGRSASCWALLKRWISSMNSTVIRPRLSRALASSTTLRISATPERTAENSTNSACQFWARSRARVVLPVPGGPQKTREVGRSPANSLCRARPSAKRWDCPTNSARVCGRRRSARGALLKAAGAAGDCSNKSMAMPSPQASPPGAEKPRDGRPGRLGRLAAPLQRQVGLGEIGPVQAAHFRPDHQVGRLHLQMGEPKAHEVAGAQIGLQHAGAAAGGRARS